MSQIQARRSDPGSTVRSETQSQIQSRIETQSQIQSQIETRSQDQGLGLGSRTRTGTPGMARTGTPGMARTGTPWHDPDYTTLGTPVLVLADNMASGMLQCTGIWSWGSIRGPRLSPNESQ